VHSLLFADDFLICGRADIQEATTINTILHSFCTLSGKTPSWAKLGVIFSKHVDPGTVHTVTQIFPVALIDSTFIHLGHPLILTTKDKTSSYYFVLENSKPSSLHIIFLMQLVFHSSNMCSHLFQSATCLTSYSPKKSFQN
jgi:hypothetical protein